MRKPLGRWLTFAAAAALAGACGAGSADRGTIAVPAPAATVGPSAAGSPALRSAQPLPTVPPPLPAPGIAVNLTSTSDGANRTSTATVRGTTVPGTICVITVTEASGQPPPAGLGPKTADGAGAVIWSWSATTAASWSIDLVCGGYAAHAALTAR